MTASAWRLQRPQEEGKEERKKACVCIQGTGTLQAPQLPLQFPASLGFEVQWAVGNTGSTERSTNCAAPSEDLRRVTARVAQRKKKKPSGGGSNFSGVEVGFFAGRPGRTVDFVS